MADHDHSYKLLFSHTRMVRDLLEGFVGGDWLARLDFGSLERVDGSHTSDNLRARTSDIVWRIRHADRYVYLLVEFQSGIESFMPVRVLTYVGLLYQDLIRARRTHSDDVLPPVLPIVLYNGSPRWSAAEELASLLCESPVELQRYRPSLRYLLIDEGAYDDAALAGHNLVALLFRLENSQTLVQLEQLVRTLADELRAPEQDSLRRAFAVWLDNVILARPPFNRAITANKLWENQSMLSDLLDKLDRDLREGREKGRQQGVSALVARQLKKRFGELPDSVRAHLQTAHTSQLEAWAEQLLDARSLDEMFDTDKQRTADC